MVYSELKAAIAEWAHRSNVPAATIDLFIDLAEAEFNLRLRCVEQETVAALACTTKYTELPTGFLEMRLVEYLSLIHISEPPRPYYISYAVFCLKKKNHNNTETV